MSVHNANHERRAEERELRLLLSQWAAVEPQRCRQQDDDCFEVLYSDRWMEVTAQPASHGTIIAAVLEGCHSNQVYCEIEYTPRYEDQPPTIEVGCIYKAFRWDEGDEVIYSIPSLLLTEYLERLPADKSDL
jgi:hypothetical protein